VLLGQLVEQRLGVLQIGGIKALGENIVAFHGHRRRNVQPNYVLRWATVDALRVSNLGCSCRATADDEPHLLGEITG
jgi:hypothetical protein